MFENKIFAENVVYQGRRVKLSDEGAFEAIHSKLNALEVSDDTAMMSVVSRGAMIQQSQAARG